MNNPFSYHIRKKVGFAQKIISYALFANQKKMLKLVNHWMFIPGQ